MMGSSFDSLMIGHYILEMYRFLVIIFRSSSQDDSFKHIILMDSTDHLFDYFSDWL